MRYLLFCGRLAALVLLLLVGSLNASAAGKSVHARVVYVALGASDTVGVGSANPARDNWTALLARHLPVGSRYLNLGHSGITLSGALSSELPPALAAHPTLVTIWLAVNDFNAQVDPQTYGVELDRFLAALQAKHARIFVGNVPDLRLIPAYAKLPPTTLDQAVRAYNVAIAAAAARHGATVVDIYGHSSLVLQHPEFISSDDFHPSGSGYSALAKLFYDVMHRRGAL